jgi:hypothetical protein
VELGDIHYPHDTTHRVPDNAEANASSSKDAAVLSSLSAAALSSSSAAASSSSSATAAASSSSSATAAASQKDRETAANKRKAEGDMDTFTCKMDAFTGQMRSGWNFDGSTTKYKYELELKTGGWENSYAHRHKIKDLPEKRQTLRNQANETRKDKGTTEPIQVEFVEIDEALAAAPKRITKSRKKDDDNEDGDDDDNYKDDDDDNEDDGHSDDADSEDVAYGLNCSTLSSREPKAIQRRVEERLSSSFEEVDWKALQNLLLRLKAKDHEPELISLDHCELTGENRRQLFKILEKSEMPRDFEICAKELSILHKCHMLIQMKEELFLDERHCAQACLEAIMFVHMKLDLLVRRIHIDGDGSPQTTATEATADLEPFEDLLQAVGALDLCNDELTLVLDAEALSDASAHAKNVRDHMKDVFYDAIDKIYGKGWGEVLFADPFVQDTLIPLVAWPGHRTKEHLYFLYCDFLRCPRFREYQQRQVRVYCNFFPLSTRIVSHFLPDFARTGETRGPCSS